MLTKKQAALFWRCLAAAAERQAVPDREAYRKRILREELGVEHLRDVDRTEGFDRLMLRLAQDAEDWQALAYYSVAGERRLADLVADCATQVLDLCPTIGVHPIAYIGGVLNQSAMSPIRTVGEDYWLDLAPDDLARLLQILDTHRRRLLKRAGYDQNLAYVHGRRWNLVGGRPYFTDPPAPQSAFKVNILSGHGPQPCRRTASSIVTILVLLSTLCAGLSARAETLRERYWRLYRERNQTTRYGTPPHTTSTNSLRFLEYVESTGAQYVDTGIVPVASTFSFHGVFAVYDLSTTHGIFGCRNQDAQAGTHSYNAFIHNGNLRADTIGEATWQVSVAVDTPIDYVYTPTKTTINGTSRNNKSKVNALYSFYLFNFHVSYGAYSGGGVAQRVYSWTIHVGNTLVRDFRPVKDAAGVAGLLDMVSGEVFYSATSTPLIAGPEKPVSSAVSMNPEDIRAWLAPPPGSGEVTDGDLWLDCLAIPEGNWLCECPIDGSTNTAWRAAICPSNILSAVVWRHAVGLAPTNLPVTIAHDPARTIGRIERLYYEQGTGVVARLRIRSAGYAAARTDHCTRISPDLRCFTTGTNVAIRDDGWVHEHQTYIDERLVPRGDADYSAVTNVPASIQAVVMAPIFLKGVSFVQVPLLPTYVEQIVPASVTNAYPLRPPRPWHW